MDRRLRLGMCTSPVGRHRAPQRCGCNAPLLCLLFVSARLSERKRGEGEREKGERKKGGERVSFSVSMRAGCGKARADSGWDRDGGAGREFPLGFSLPVGLFSLNLYPAFCCQSVLLSAAVYVLKRCFIP